MGIPPFAGIATVTLFKLFVLGAPALLTVNAYEVGAPFAAVAGVILAVYTTITSIAGLVLGLMVLLFAGSEAVMVVAAGFSGVTSFTPNVPVPATSAASAGNTACRSLEAICTVSFTLLTTFQLSSTALTVTLNAPFTYSMLGVPVLPFVVPGAAVSPGTNTCNFVNVPALTVSVAPPCAPLVYVPVTACDPAMLAVHAAPVHEPSGVIVNVVPAVTSPAELLKLSRPCAAYIWLAPAAIVLVCGVNNREVMAPAFTCRLAVPVLPLSVPVTVCGPATVAVQTAPVHEPSGAMLNVVAPVTSPKLFPVLSKPVAV